MKGFIQQLTQRLRLLDSKDGVNFPNTRGVVIVDALPNVGTFLEGFVASSQEKNIPMLYIPLLSDDQHAEWFIAYWHEELARCFQNGELVVPNMERLALGLIKTNLMLNQ